MTYLDKGVTMNEGAALGLIKNQKTVNKFGRALSGVQQTATDIWDRADATPTQQLWVAPTQARVHSVVSTDTDDNSLGTGAKLVKIYGLTDWDTAEVSEDIIMDGTTSVNTSNSYVIIHRMKVIDYGSTGPNEGTITATAATDSSVTAQINIGQGQTQMAIYGIPSTQTALMTKYYTSCFKGSTSLGLISNLLVNQNVENELDKFLVKHSNGLASEGTSYISHEFNPCFAISGPAIIKINATSSVSDTDGSGGFDLKLIDN